MRVNIFVAGGLVFLLVAAGLVWWQYANSPASPAALHQYLVYDHVREQWQPSAEAPPIVLTTDNSDGFHNPTVMRGGFDHYDHDNHTLFIKTSLDFTGRSLYQLRALQLGVLQTVYCMPARLPDFQTGQTQSALVYRFPVYDGQILYTYQERPLPLEQFLQQVHAETWLFVQLLAPYTVEGPNYLQKVVAVGLCES